MRHRLLVATVSLSLIVSLSPAGRGHLILKATAQTPEVVPPKQHDQVLPKRPEKVPPKNNADLQVEPAAQDKTTSKHRPVLPPRTIRWRGSFRVTLNGFRVNRESYDDILEGDGRGDEIFITWDVWVIHKDGTYQSYRQRRTSVMGDPNGHPERVAAGTKSPGPLNTNLDALQIGGLQTYDTFPSREPWKHTGEPLTDRPPVVLWEGTLTQGDDMVLILPIIWEWDSDDTSDSQRSVSQGLPLWFEHQRPALLTYFTSPPGSRSSIFLSGSIVLNSVDNLYRYNTFFIGADHGMAFQQGRIALSGKAGTRPIGYEEAYTTGRDFGGVSLPDGLTPIELMLTYDSAASAARSTANFGVPGAYEINYKDAHDNGDYSLYLQVEKLDEH